MSSNIGKPRKKKLIGVASAAGQGAINGGSAGWLVSAMHKTGGGSPLMNRKTILPGAALGAGIAGYNKYRQLSKPKKIKVGKIK